MANITGIPDKLWQPSIITIDTSLGEFSIELYWKHAPNTCRNFAELSRRGYYNNTVFHRIISDFMIQGGDPTGTGRGGNSIYGKEFVDEIHPDLRHSGAGIISMANSGPNTNLSQFFITLSPTQHLDGKHTIFGRVYSGMGVIKRLGNVDTNRDDRPIEENIMAAREPVKRIIQQVRPILSVDREEARQRVINLYKAWHRTAPFIVEKFDIPKSVPQVRQKLKEEFLKNKDVSDVRVIDMLVIKGQMELKETTKIWKQKGHIMRYWQESIEPKSNDFLSKFMSGHN
ncbi:CLUMA_CG020890, isoform A [Clunio marinus]|uniref:Peptidyl-prolyl cis-trans isomerase n=1 Tax=Clunio marinus TaxID=568069 RepID=A0A1J1J7B6_9DIPT|nr:CLUMA_CG020890, isoform A [Clunio marinus]